MELKADPDRYGHGGGTGIYVRAKTPDGKWGSVELAELDRDSVIVWLKSRGGDNLWAENCVLSMLGHEQVLGPVPNPQAEPK